MAITMIGLDTAKSVFQVHGVDSAGKVQLKRKLRRDELLPFFEKQEKCIVVIALTVPLIWIEGRMTIKNPASRAGFAIGIGAASLGF
jgi:hypothetical protein